MYVHVCRLFGIEFTLSNINYTGERAYMYCMYIWITHAVTIVLQLKHCYMEEMEAEQEFIDDMGIGQFIDQQRAADSSHKANNQQRAADSSHKADNQQRAADASHKVNNQQRAADSSQTTNTSQSQTMNESYIVGYRYI